jgi:outer membrane murein-binding lipoprotein Lpp
MEEMEGPSKLTFDLQFLRGCCSMATVATPTPMKLTTILLYGALIWVPILLSGCTAVESVSRTAKNVLGIPERQEQPAMQFGGVRNEYHAALERRKRDSILEILGEGGAR